MPSFAIKSRTLGPVVDATVDATSLGQAIDKTVQAAPDGAEVQVINAEAVPVAPVPEGAKAEQKALPSKHA